MPSGVVKVKGGDKYKALLAKIAAQKVGVKVGIFANDTNEDTGEPIAPYAAANEFGAGKIPSRPFMRNTVAKRQGDWIKIVEQYMKVRPDNARGAMEIVGQTMATDIGREIDTGSFERLSDASIERHKQRGRGKEAGKGQLKSDPERPLIDTGSMRQAIGYEVIEG